MRKTVPVSQRIHACGLTQNLRSSYPQGCLAQYTTWAQAVENHMAANGGLSIISQRESIEAYGHSANIDKTMEEIARHGQAALFEPTMG